MGNPGLLFENTLVALFDIQAYSAFIETVSAAEAVERSLKLYQFAKSASSTDFGTIKTRFWVLSDTVVVAIDTNRSPLSFGSAYLFLITCSSFLHDSLRFCNFPMRGAIGAGYLYFEEDEKKDEFGECSFLLGSALVDAAKHEREQNWLGARITPNAVEAVRSFVSDEDGKMILECKKLEGVCKFGEIPLKLCHPEKGNEYRVESGHYLLPYFKNPDWKTDLPAHFDAEEKLRNSDKLWMPEVDS